MSNAVLSTFLVLSIAATASAQKITKESLTSQGTARTYYLFVPDYGRSPEINKAAWAFLQGKRLEKDPQYQDYVMRR
jgi:hypothetical protein